MIGADIIGINPNDECLDYIEKVEVVLRATSAFLGGVNVMLENLFLYLL